MVVCKMYKIFVTFFSVTVNPSFLIFCLKASYWNALFLGSIPCFEIHLTSATTLPSKWIFWCTKCSARVPNFCGWALIFCSICYNCLLTLSKMVMMFSLQIITEKWLSFNLHVSLKKVDDLCKFNFRYNFLHTKDFFFSKTW